MIIIRALMVTIQEMHLQAPCSAKVLQLKHQNTDMLQPFLVGHPQG